MPSSLLLAALAVPGLCMLAPDRAQAQSITWSQKVVSGPLPRQVPGMAYDSARGVTVLFGGITTNNVVNAETWEWNGATWTSRPVGGPLSARCAQGMAYDSARHVTVLFGGLTTGGGFSNETFEYNGTTWTRRVVTGPSARYGPAMAYDSARGVTVLFGGYNGSINLSDTWEWNGSTWTPRVVTGPSPRIYSAMAYDAARGVTVLFGGAGGVYHDDTWEWNGVAWTQRAVTGPSGRWGPAIYDSARHVTVICGGLGVGNVFNNDTWEWDGSAWTQRAVSGPTPRSGHAMAYDAARGITVLYGGLTSATVANGETWELCVSPSITAPLIGQSACSGASASFAVSVSGSRPLTYAWRKGTVPIDTGVGGNPSAATATLLLTNISAADAASYDCIVSNTCGSVTSNPATLTVNPVPTISQQPSNIATCRNGSADLSIAASDTLGFRWQIETSPNNWMDIFDGGLPYNGGTIIGVGTTTNHLHLTCTVLPGAPAVRLRCVASNTCAGIASNAATVSWNDAPTFDQPPSGQTVCPNGSASFSVAPSGVAPLTYQWRKDSEPIDAAANPTAATATLTLTDVSVNDVGSYDCIVTNTCGSTTSDPASLSICTGDFNCDGGIDGADIEAFFADWESGSPAADVNADGGIDGADVSTFFEHWENGC